MERVKEPGLSIPGSGRIYRVRRPLRYWRCWVCGERAYRRSSRQRLLMVETCVRCGAAMEPREDGGRGECPACLAARDYGQAVCPVCGEAFTKRTPVQVTCGKEACRRKRQSLKSGEAEKRRRREKWVRIMEEAERIKEAENAGE